MNTIELNAITHNGRISITLPEECRDAWNEKPVRVIVMMEEETNKREKQSLLSHLKQIHISGPKDLSDEHDAYQSGEKNA